MEKFALLDFLKAFQTFTANNAAEKEQASPPQPAPVSPQQAQPSPPPAPQQRNPMADVLARHEEIANRIKNKRPV